MMMLGLDLVILRKMGEVEGWWGVLKGGLFVSYLMLML